MKIPQAGGGSSIINLLEPLIEAILPENIIFQDERKYMGNLAFSLSELHKPSSGLRKIIPVEYGYGATENLPNSTYIIMTRYPLLPYWNRYYSHPYIEDLSKFSYSKVGSRHIYRYYNDACAHAMVEISANDVDGFKLAHTVLAFTY